MQISCIFCGVTGPLTREHVFGQWVSKTGLDLRPVQHRAGPNNGLRRDLGKQPPYRLKVKNVCATCNNGWMSKLEDAAQRVLTPFILGKSGTIERDEQHLVAMWAQKTALTAMLLSSEEQRERGYGLSKAEYRALYESQQRKQPLGGSRLWIGRYQGEAGFWAIRVMPFTLRAARRPEPDLPVGYTLTIVLGELVVHGARFVSSDSEIDVTMDLGMPQLWPSRTPVRWPEGAPCNDDEFPGFSTGKMLRSANEHFELKAWTRAAELPQSSVVGDKVGVPALCRKHVLYYPIALLREVSRGRFYAFTTACECPVAYLLQTEADGTHCKAAGSAEGISKMYEDLVGDEVIIPGDKGDFYCKRLPAEATTVESYVHA
ncbi:hypothetical protein ACIPWF_21795 [Paenarthrobacter sp. NPDC089989]|uniref:hypothetical protein n=1 Tax=unclassified Paenarthrobacter TaxID=2634190 RepID=UPI0037FBB733